MLLVPDGRDRVMRMVMLVMVPELLLLLLLPVNLQLVLLLLLQLLLLLELLLLQLLLLLLLQLLLLLELVLLLRELGLLFLLEHAELVNLMHLVVLEPHIMMHYSLQARHAVLMIVDRIKLHIPRDDRLRRVWVPLVVLVVKPNRDGILVLRMQLDQLRQDCFLHSERRHYTGGGSRVGVVHVASRVVCLRRGGEKHKCQRHDGQSPNETASFLGNHEGLLCRAGDPFTEAIAELMSNS
jgi:hypothetical protein